MVRVGNVQLCNKDIGTLFSIVIIKKYGNQAISLNDRVRTNMYRMTEFIQEIQKAITFIPKRWGRVRFRFDFFYAKLLRHHRKLLWILICCMTRSVKFYLPEPLRKVIWEFHSPLFSSSSSLSLVFS